MYLEMGKVGLAISLLHRAAAMTPQADILCNLAIAYRQSGQQEKMFKIFKDAIKKNPSADVLGNYAGLYVNYGTPDEAIKQAKKAIKLDPNCKMAHWNMALALLEKGEWKEAWEEHEWGLKLNVRVDRKYGDIPYWDGTEGKTIIVYGEQGLGDEIMFASMLPDLIQNNKVILECHKRLVHLFEESFPELEVHGTREDLEIDWFTGADYRVSIGSLGKWFRNDRNDFPGSPYLIADTLPSGKKFRVGISWTGGLKPGRIAARSVPLQLWGSILTQDCEFVSLQYTECEEDLKETEELYGIKIKRFDEVKAEDYYETAKLVNSCDLVITIATSVYHLAGALGVPCWVMVPNKPAWREQFKGGIPWYRSVRLYRQPDGGKEMWIPVLEKVGLDLSEQLEEIRCNSFTPKAPTENIVDTPFVMETRLQ